MKQDENNETRITLRLPREVYRQLRIEAARREMSATRLINLLLAQNLAHLDATRQVDDG